MSYHPRLVAFDLDGTLAESKQRLSAEMGEGLAALLKKMPVAVMSGASWEQFEKQFFPALPIDTNFSNLYIFPDNAGQCFVWREDSWKPQYDYTFSKEEKDHIVLAINKALDHAGILKSPYQVWGERIEDRGAEIALSILGQEAPLEAKENWHQAHETERDAVRSELQNLLPQYSVSEGGLTTIQVTHKSINKAHGLRRLMELTRVDLNEMLYVGDALDEGGNDAVVLDTGVRTHQVFSPEETYGLIQGLLK